MALIYKTVEVEGKKLIETNEKGYPIIFDDAKENHEEMSLDAIHLYSKVPALTNEVKQIKENYANLQQNVKPLVEANIEFEKLTDFINDAAKNKKLVDNFDSKKLVEAGEVEAIKRQALEAKESELKALKESLGGEIEKLNGTVAAQNGRIHKLMVDDRFNTSEFVKTQMSSPPRIVRSHFGRNFKVEEMDDELVVVGYHNNERIYSRERPGEIAPFEEALSIMVDKDPDKDNLLIGRKAKGGGADSSMGPFDHDTLQKEYDEALKAGNVPAAIAIKNKMFKIHEPKK